MPIMEPSIQNEPRRKGMPLFLRVLCGFALLVLIGVPTLLLIANLWGEHLWKRYQSDAARRAVKMELSEFLEPPVPPEQNFAEIPIFRKVFVEAEKGRVVDPLELPSSRNKLEFGGAGKAKLTDLATIRDICVEARLLEKERASELTASAGILAALSRYEPALLELREGSQRPHARFPLVWEDGALVDASYLGLFTSAARLNRLRALCFLEEGRTDEAAREIEATIRLEEHLRTEAFLISGLVRISLVSIVADTIWEGLARGRWKDAHLTRFKQALAPISMLASYRTAMEGERVLLNQFYAAHADRSTPGRDRLFRRISMRDDALAPKWLPLLSGCVRGNQAASNRYFDELIGHVDVEQGRYFPSRPTPSAPAEMIGFLDRSYFLMHCRLASVYMEIEKRAAYAEVYLRMTRVACALEEQRLRDGAYPAGLTDLKFEGISDPSRDILTGEPLGYFVKPAGRFCLYSVGLNLQDDGGTAGYVSGKKTVADGTKRKRQESWRKHLDWVWEYPVAAEP